MEGLTTRRSTALAAVGLVLTVAAARASASATDLGELQTRGELKVLAVNGNPYFVAFNPAAPPGFDREIVEGFARLKGLNVKLIEVPSWDALIPALTSGKGDVIVGGLTVTPPRKALIDFTVEVFPTRNVVITRKPRKPVATLEELRQERVGTIKGTSLAQAVADAKVPPKNIDDSVAPSAFGEALKSGKVTALVDGVEDALLLQQADPEIELGLFLGSPESLAFAVRKDSPQLHQALDEYLSNFRRTPTWNRLLVKYFGGSAIEVLKRARAE
jgi:ABC-type amino acid transport substrate-binding protein